MLLPPFEHWSLWDISAFQTKPNAFIYLLNFYLDDFIKSSM